MSIFVCIAALFVASTSAFFGGKSSVCIRGDGYVPIEGVCDAYTECNGLDAVERQCPDGLYFDRNILWPADPCGYPTDIPCEGRTQPAKPTPECKHQYGFFPSPMTSNDCGQYRMCVEGRATDMFCPTGLAFNPTSSRCEWPENVPSCNLENFLGYKCPPAELDRTGNPIVTNHKYEKSCYEFYSCVNGNARLLSCDVGYAFDAHLSRCVREDLVACDHEKINRY
ncbi:protein obstructor-E-like [Bicyclus anynana]|uniref:Protein obstructor-E-like n=1 Tax=Bicyclus anynana TaxID=110368 RepID=A0ABM3LDN7_BICAN|nr:protein obstructor-E-like [Bicyclus anynana]